MKKLMMLIVIGCFCSCLHLNGSDENDGWIKVETKDGYELFTKTIAQFDGRLKKINGIRGNGVIIPLARVRYSADDICDEHFDEPREYAGGLSCLSCDNQDAQLEHAKTMQLAQPKLSPTYLARQQQKNLQEQSCDGGVDKALNDRVPHRLEYNNLGQAKKILNNSSSKQYELTDFDEDDTVPL